MPVSFFEAADFSPAARLAHAVDAFTMLINSGSVLNKR